MAAVAAVDIFSGKSPAAVTALVVARGCFKKSKKFTNHLKCKTLFCKMLKGSYCNMLYMIYFQTQKVQTFMPKMCSIVYHTKKYTH
jgi:hypothetical protein